MFGDDVGTGNDRTARVDDGSREGLRGGTLRVGVGAQRTEGRDHKDHDPQPQQPAIHRSILSTPPPRRKARHFPWGPQVTRANRRQDAPVYRDSNPSSARLTAAQSREWENLYAVPISGQAQTIGRLGFGLLDLDVGSIGARAQKNGRAAEAARPSDYPITRLRD